MVFWQTKATITISIIRDSLVRSSKKESRWTKGTDSQPPLPESHSPLAYHPFRQVLRTGNRLTSRKNQVSFAETEHRFCVAIKSCLINRKNNEIFAISSQTAVEIWLIKFTSAKWNNSVKIKTIFYPFDENIRIKSISNR